MQTSAKQHLQQALARLPDDCSYDEALYRLYVVSKIQLGLADTDAGRTIPHEQVAEEFRRKWLLGDDE